MARWCSLRKWLWRAPFTLCLLGVVLWLLSNLWLISPWGRAKLGQKLSERAGVPCEIAGAWWWPGIGCHVWGLKSRVSEQEETQLQVGKVFVQISWGDLLEKRLKIRELEIQQPEVVVDLDDLESLLDRQRELLESEQQVVPQIQPQVVPEALAAPTPENVKEAVQGEEIKGEEVPNGATAKAETPKRKTPTEAPKKSAAPQVAKQPVQVNLREGAFRLQKGGKEILSLGGVSLQLSLADTVQKGYVSLNEVKLLGEPFAESLRVPVICRGGVVSVEPREVTLGGFRFQWAAHFHLRHRLFSLLMNAPQQSFEHGAGENEVAQGVSYVIEHAMAQGQLSGRLDQPASWRGQWIGRAEGIHARDGTGQVSFERGGVQLFCTQGRLIAPSVELRSEDLSLLGNGYLQSDGFACAVLRLIGSPEVADFIKLRLHPEIPVQDWWADFQTPDRKYRDLHVEGPLGQWKLQQGAEWISLSEWLPDLRNKGF